VPSQIVAGRLKLSLFYSLGTPIATAWSRCRLPPPSSRNGDSDDDPSTTDDRGLANAQPVAPYPDRIYPTSFPVCTLLQQVAGPVGSGGNPHLPDLLDERKEARSRFDTDSGLRALLLLQSHDEDGLALRRSSPAPQEAAETTHHLEPRGGYAFSRLRGKQNASGDLDDLLRGRVIRMDYKRVNNLFCRLRRCAEIRRESAARYQPRIHDIRHSTAVHRVIAWYRSGADVQQLLPQLATYLGHVDIASTQRYLTMTAELLNEASLRFERYAQLGVRDA